MMNKRALFSVTVVLFICCVFTPAEANPELFFKTESQYQDVVIKDVRSTNTIVLDDGPAEKGEVIQLIGLKAIEIPRKSKTDIERDEHGFVIKKEVDPRTPLDEQAMTYVRELLAGRHVRLEFDIEKKGEEFVTLAYVFLLEDNTFVNAEIIRQGYAHLSILPPNTKYANALREAYKEARAEKRGLQGQ